VTLEVVGGRGSVEVLCDSAATNKHVIHKHTRDKLLRQI